jgi:Icc-related predicted phosphoesterase
MKISLASDIHTEFAPLSITNTHNADTLILAGDITLANSIFAYPDMYKHRPEDPNIIWKLDGKQKLSVHTYDLFKRASDEFEDVVYCLGNHEYYGGNFPDAVEWLGTFCSKFPNVHLLEMENKKIGGVTFVGGTLWTDLNKMDPMTEFHLSQRMNDYHSIKKTDKIYGSYYSKLRPSHTYAHHKKTLDYIKHVVENDTNEKYVVVTHHAPSFKSVHEQFKHDTYMNGGYASELDDFIIDHPQINLWCHGHMHNPSDYFIGSTRIVANPRGYIGREPRAAHFQLNLIEI